MLILGIETSCDETSVALVEGKGERVRVIAEATSSQVKLHRPYGGVVPEVAARRHVEVIIPLLDRVVSRVYRLRTTDYRRTAYHRKTVDGRQWTVDAPPLDAIAVTAGPGLLTSLLVGVETAKTLSYLWNKPLVRVQHIVGHIYANWLAPISDLRFKILDFRIEFPALALVVSGGHTELILMRGHGRLKVLGRTRDDAAGEAFDKVAALLGLPYPGGPQISALAEISRTHADGTQTNAESPRKSASGQRKSALWLPRPMIDSDDYDFSFAGLKTAVLYWLRDHKNVIASEAKQSHKLRDRHARQGLARDDKLRNLSASFEQAVVDVLVAKTLRAAREYKVKTVLLGGGVAANTRLRTQLAHAIHNLLPTSYFLLPSLRYTSDNAAMIAAAGYFTAREGKFTPWKKVYADPEWEL